MSSPIQRYIYIIYTNMIRNQTSTPDSLQLEFLILIELAPSVNPSGRQLRSGCGWSCVCAGDCSAVIPLVSGSGHLSTRVSLQLRLPWGCVGVIRWGWLPRGLHCSCMGLIPLAGASVRVVTTIETPYCLGSPVKIKWHEAERDDRQV